LPKEVPQVPNIADSKILIVATDGFEESELFGPRKILIDRGADVRLASREPRPIQATVHDDPGKTIRPDMVIEDASAADFDALILPGGVRNPDALRTNKAAIALIRAFAEAGKPVAAICHGPWLLVEADLVRGRTVTCRPPGSTRAAASNIATTPAFERGPTRRSSTACWSSDSRWQRSVRGWIRTSAPGR
jgi:protease I